MALVAPGEIDQTRLARTGAADRVDQRIVGFEERIAGDHGDAGVERLGHLARGLFEIGRPHVVGRRVDQIAREEHAFGETRDQRAVDALGQHEARLVLARGLLAVAVEGVGADRPRIGGAGAGERGRDIGERIDAGRQALGERGERMRVAAGAETEHGRPNPAVLAGDELQLALFRREPDRVEPARLVWRALSQEALQVLGQDGVELDRRLAAELVQICKDTQHARP